MIFPSAIEFFDPPDIDIGRETYADAGLIPPVEAERLAALHHVHRARACLAALADMLRVAPGPEGDAQADAFAEQFEIECQRAGSHIAALRLLRECQGWG